jgi:hypothetical protein
MEILEDEQDEGFPPDYYLVDALLHNHLAHLVLSSTTRTFSDGMLELILHYIPFAIKMIGSADMRNGITMKRSLERLMEYVPSNLHLLYF